MNAVCLGICVIAGALILHEGGHAIAALLTGIRTREILVGFGPSLFKVRIRGVAVSLRVLPLGAGVDIDDDGYRVAPAWKKAVLLAAGPAANLLGCLAALAGVGWLWVGSGSFLLRTAIAGLFSLKATAQVVGATVAAVTSGKAEMVGPVGLVALLRGLGRVEPDVALLVFACVSAGAALFNLFPLPPLDGGRLVVDVLGARMPGRIRRCLEVLGIAVVCAMTVLVMAGDLLGLVVRR